MSQPHQRVAPIAKEYCTTVCTDAGALRPRAVTFADAGITAALEAVVRRMSALDGVAYPPFAWDNDAPLPAGREQRSVYLERVALGERLETHVQEEVRNMKKYTLSNSTTKSDDTLARRWFESYAAAVWTSCHVHAIETGCAPSLLTVPCASNQPSLCFLLDHILVKGCGRSMKPLLQMMLRSVTHGSRGWTTMATRLVASSQSTRHVLVHAVLVSLAGMHAVINPLDRPSWKERLLITKRASVELCAQSLQDAWLLRNMQIVKEVSRRLLIDALHDSIAALDVVAALAHPLGKLSRPPEALPMHGVQEASRLVCEVGRLCLRNDDSFRLCKGSSALDAHEASGWMARAGCHSSPATLVERAKDVFHAAFRAEFAPFWLHALAKGHRAHRLDPVQYDCINKHSAATRLCNALTPEDAYHATRAALILPTASTSFISEAAAVLGFANPEDSDGVRRRGVLRTIDQCSRHATSTLVAMAPLGVTASAMLLQFARVAHLSDAIMIVELGSHTRMTHERALRRRLLLSEHEPLPAHLSVVTYCCECSRACNAFVGVKARVPTPVSILEFGMSAITTSYVDAEGDECLRCARRSSAALRSAQLAQTIAEQRELDGDALENVDDPHCDAVAQTSHDGSLASRLRRDAKNVHSQQRSALPCGSTPLVQVPILGRAVRLSGTWYTLCSFCGVHMTVASGRRFESEMCCFQCDPTVIAPGLAPKGLPSASSGKRPSDSSVPQCRYCGRTETRKTSTFVRVSSPNDLSDRNRHLPQSLRVTHWCKAHYRQWIPGAMRTMTTNQVLAHISEKARPMTEAMEAIEGVRADDREKSDNDRQELVDAGVKSKGRQPKTVHGICRELDARRKRKQKQGKQDGQNAQNGQNGSGGGGEGAESDESEDGAESDESDGYLRRKLVKTTPM